ncbi:MAG: carbohydrate porin [Alphaproteobacteria bacterium]|nr:carbohydrate porin [Alphaproteobacteria bacterium]
MNRTFCETTALSGALLLLGSLLAVVPVPASAEGAPPAEAPKPTGFWERDTLTGDWGGLRSSLADAGFALGATETGDMLATASGAVKQKATAFGRLELDLDVDFEKAVGLHGGTLHASALQLHGSGLNSPQRLGSNTSFGGTSALEAPSGIEAVRGTRLFDAYYQQTLIGDKLSVRAGQISLDDEFAVSSYGANFVNSTFGWPGMFAADLPSGGTAYPLASPGARVKISPSDTLSWQTGVTASNPAGKGNALDLSNSASNTLPQRRNNDGTTFSTAGGTMVITEFAYTVAADKDHGVVPASYKIGAWYNTGKFTDLEKDIRGNNLAVTGLTPRIHKGDYALYGMVDQMLLHTKDTDDGGLSGFLRLFGTPQSDRNLVTFQADVGVNYKGLLPGRDNDIAGLAFGLDEIGGRQIAYDKDFRTANRLPNAPIHDYESVIELTYQYVLSPWWTIQPNLQYILHPGGNMQNPAPGAVVGKTIDDAFIAGLRTAIKL